MLAYPNSYASYTVPVRQYRILQSRFLQCILHSKPPCDLLMLPVVTPAHKGFTPSGKITPTSIATDKFVFLSFFSSIEVGVHCSCRAHTSCIRNATSDFERGLVIWKGLVCTANTPVC